MCLFVAPGLEGTANALHDSSGAHRCGFAAGCEAGLCPAVTLIIEIGLGPWFGLWPKNIGAKPEPWAQPTFNFKVDGGAEPRLTSGGEPQRCPR